MSHCFETKDAALAEKTRNAANDPKNRIRIYEITKPEPDSITRYVLGVNRDVALARFSSEVLSVAIADGSAKASKGVGKKQLDAAVARVVAATGDEQAAAVADLKKLQEQMAAAKARKEAAKAAKASETSPASSAAAPSAPTPPSVPVPPSA